MQSRHVINSAVKALTFYARKQYLVRCRLNSGHGQPPVQPLFAPRIDEIVKSALVRTGKNTARRNDADNVDIQADVRATNLNRADFITSALCMLTLTFAVIGKPSDIATSLAVTVGHMLCVHTFGRNNEVRAMCFKHLSIQQQAGVGPDIMWVVRFITNLSKCNQNGHLEQSSVTPHKDASLCSIGFIVLSLLIRWYVLHEPLPDVRTRAGWYSFHLMPGAKSLDERMKMPDGGFKSKADAAAFDNAQRVANAPVTYAKCHSFISTTFKNLGKAVPKKGHLGRVLGAIMADNESLGRERVPIADNARWNKQDASRSSYLLAAPVAGIFLAAQYAATDAANYVCLRLRLNLADKPSLHNVFAKKLFPAQAEDESEVTPRPHCFS